MHSYLIFFRWQLLGALLFLNLIAAFWQTPLVNSLSPVLIVLTGFTVVWLHGCVRYGMRNMLVFFLITWLTSHFAEALSIQTGFPFGHYYYDKLAGPRLFEVPLIIMFAYFTTGYAAWSLSNILLDTQGLRLQKKDIFWVPFVAAFIMVMWDLCIDPLCSTVASLWRWKENGAYFGVPLQNYFGWFLTVFILYLLFALYISGRDVSRKTFQKSFWYEMVIIYGIQGLTQYLQYLGAQSHADIYASMALITTFSMLFVVVLAVALLQRK